MFEPTSRYANVPTSETVLPDGRRVRFTRCRVLPQGRLLPAVIELVTADSDRLDLIAARTLADPERYWLICDANDVMNPAELLGGSAVRLRIPLTGQSGGLA